MLSAKFLTDFQVQRFAFYCNITSLSFPEEYYCNLLFLSKRKHILLLKLEKKCNTFSQGKMLFWPTYFFLLFYRIVISYARLRTNFSHMSFGTRMEYAKEMRGKTGKNRKVQKNLQVHICFVNKTSILLLYNLL